MTLLKICTVFWWLIVAAILVAAYWLGIVSALKTAHSPKPIDTVNQSFNAVTLAGSDDIATANKMLERYLATELAQSVHYKNPD